MTKSREGSRQRQRIPASGLRHSKELIEVGENENKTWREGSGFSMLCNAEKHAAKIVKNTVNNAIQSRPFFLDHPDPFSSTAGVMGQRRIVWQDQWLVSLLPKFLLSLITLLLGQSQLLLEASQVCYLLIAASKDCLGRVRSFCRVYNQDEWFWALGYAFGSQERLFTPVEQER